MALGASFFTRYEIVLIPRCRSILIGRVGDAHFREAIAERVAREAEGARGLAFVAVGAAQGFANHFLLPMFESDALGKCRWSGGSGRRAGSGAIEMDVRGVQVL